MLAWLTFILHPCFQISNPSTFFVSKGKIISLLLSCLLFVVFSIALSSPFEFVALVLILMVVVLHLHLSIADSPTLNVPKGKVLPLFLSKLPFVVLGVPLTSPLELVALMLAWLTFILHPCFQISNPFAFSITEIEVLPLLLCKSICVIFSITLASPLKLIALMFTALRFVLQFYFIITNTSTFGITECKIISLLLRKLHLVILCITLTGPLELIALMLIVVVLVLRLCFQVSNHSALSITKC